MMSKTFALITTLSILLTTATSVLAGTFSTGTFSSPSALQQSDVVLAQNSGGSAVTVGSVLYTAPTYFTGDNQFSNPGEDMFSNANLNTLMQDGAYNSTMTAVLPTVAGTDYQLQLLFWDPVSGYGPGNRKMTITAGGDTLTGFDVIGTTGGWQSNVGAYVDYDFIATGSSLTLTLAGVAGGDPNAFVNAFSLATVPEPSSIVALCGLGAMGLALTLRLHRVHKSLSSSI
jgi:hypothetical protein